MSLKVVVIMHLLSLAMAQTDCYQKDMDVGGGQNSCGYMDTVAIIAADGEEKYSWFNGYFTTVPAEDIDSPEKCQAFCEGMPGCNFFAYTYPDPHADCTLKAGYHEDGCTPLYEASQGMESGPGQCPSCMKPENDVGGSQNSCGYMDTLAVYAKPNTTQQSWYKGYYVVLNDVHTWTTDVCQDLCSRTPPCAYWHMSEEHCYLKADYSSEQKAMNNGCVPLYQPFNEERDFTYFSGPKTCVEVVETVSCGTLKAAYKSGQCCGADKAKRVHM